MRRRRLRLGLEQDWTDDQIDEIMKLKDELFRKEVLAQGVEAIPGAPPAHTQPGSGGKPPGRKRAHGHRKLNGTNRVISSAPGVVDCCRVGAPASLRHGPANRE